MDGAAGSEGVVGALVAVDTERVLCLVHEAALIDIVVVVTAHGISDFLGRRLVALGLESRRRSVGLPLCPISSLLAKCLLRVRLDSVVYLVGEVLASSLAHDCKLCDVFVSLVFVKVFDSGVSWSL